MTKPNFFIVGAPKCGTSSMWDYLDAHPDVFMSQWKEPHFFSRHDLPWRKQGWGVASEAEYIALFRKAGRCRRVGEASTWYLFSRQAPLEIRNFNPQARIICMLRNPVDAICSMFHQNVSNGNEDVFDLDQALELEPLRAEGRRLPSRAPYPADFLYRRMASYTDQLTRYFDAFGRENVLVLLFDDFAADTPSVYRQALDFLGIDSAFRPCFRISNAARPIRNAHVRRFLIGRPRLRGALNRCLSPRTRGLIGATIAACVPDRNPVPIIRPETRRQLRDSFARDVQRLGDLLGRDLAHWSANQQPHTPKTT